MSLCVVISVGAPWRGIRSSLPSSDPAVAKHRRSVIIAGSMAQCDQYESGYQQVPLPVQAQVTVCVLIENSVCKFFDSQEHGSMGPLPGPVCGDQARHHAEREGYECDCEEHLDHANVPLIVANTRDITIAEMNMPASM